MHSVPIENRLAVKKRPDETAFMSQEWRDLLFLHWAYNADAIQKTLPPGLFVDTFQDVAYLTLTPFFIQNSRLFTFPTFPGLSSFIEINLRTYVYDANGTPGVWFYSLDINSLLASMGGRSLFSLPYHFANLHSKIESEKITISGKRLLENSPQFNFSYYTEQDSEVAEADSLEFFLLERYVLFTVFENQLKLGRVHHTNYPLTTGRVLEWSDSLFNLNQFKPPLGDPDYVHYSKGVEVEIFKLETSL